MKAKNNNEVTKAILQFSGFLLITVVLSVCAFSLFMKTAIVEVERIMNKTEDYDLIQIKQARLTESMDTMLYYSQLLNTDEKINNTIMYNNLNKRRLALSDELMGMNEYDGYLYKKLSVQLQRFLQTKDSIRQAKYQEDVLRIELQQCLNSNKQLAQRTYSRGIY